jgi:hypothetical protein
MIKSFLSVVALLGALMMAPASADAAGPQRAILRQEPLVFRIHDDEFRIAFGLKADGCLAHGCAGTIRYRVEWQTEDGKHFSEMKRVSYSVPPKVDSVIAVDRQYFDTAEGAHKTDIVKVTVARISCVALTGRTAGAAQMAALGAAH